MSTIALCGCWSIQEKETENCWASMGSTFSKNDRWTLHVLFLHKIWIISIPRNWGMKKNTFWKVKMAIETEAFEDVFPVEMFWCAWSENISKTGSFTHPSIDWKLPGAKWFLGWIEMFMNRRDTGSELGGTVRYRWYHPWDPCIVFLPTSYYHKKINHSCVQ